MNSLAAELTDHVIPLVPVRQFVLSLPYHLRYRLAHDHERCIAVLRIFIRAVMSFYRREARKRGVCDGRTGSVTFLQRFGSAANCNLHFHAVVLDGVFSEDENGELSFAPPSRRPKPSWRSSLKPSGRVCCATSLEEDTSTAIQSAMRRRCWRVVMPGRQSLGRRPGAKLQRIGADPEANC
jgi:hypothetical protein